MGRIFEVRKHTMFARWDRMAKQFARIAKDINIAVKAGGADPNSNPALRRAVQNSRNLNMPKDKVEAAIKRASGKDADQLRTDHLRRLRAARRRRHRRSRHRQPDAHRRPGARHLLQGRRQSRHAPAASRSSSARWACSA